MGILNLKKKTAYKFIKNKQNRAEGAKKNEVRNIARVGVLAELSLFQTYDFTKSLSNGLGIAQDEMVVFLFDRTRQGVRPENHKICDEGCFGLFGKIKSLSLERFVNKKFDLMINYCEPDLVYAQIIMLRSKARLKAGFEDENNFFNDIAIKTAGNKIDTFNTELVKYLQLLKLIN